MIPRIHSPSSMGFRSRREVVMSFTQTNWPCVQHQFQGFFISPAFATKRPIHNACASPSDVAPGSPRIQWDNQHTMDLSKTSHRKLLGSQFGCRPDEKSTCPSYPTDSQMISASAINCINLIQSNTEVWGLNRHFPMAFLSLFQCSLSK